tara:strand:- start:209 stop:427 length:219 start_codon:yes stop_codon:yes gene_type:complete
MSITQTERYLAVPTDHQVCQNLAVVDVTFEGSKNAKAVSQALKLIFQLRNGPKPIAVTVKIHDDSTVELLVK